MALIQKEILGAQGFSATLTLDDVLKVCTGIQITSNRVTPLTVYWTLAGIANSNVVPAVFSGSLNFTVPIPYTEPVSPRTGRTGFSVAGLTSYGVTG